MMETETTKKVTLDEFMQLPYEHIELIDGSIVQEPSPGYGHQRIVMDIAAEIYVHLKNSKGGEVVTAPMDVILDENVLQPDLIFISTERLSIVVDQKIKDAPDVVFEVISPSNAFHDTKVKFDIYERYGVKEYFIVYPDDKTVVKYALVNGRFHEQYREIGIVESEAMNCKIRF